MASGIHALLGLALGLALLAPACGSGSTSPPPQAAAGAAVAGAGSGGGASAGTAAAGSAGTGGSPTTASGGVPPFAGGGAGGTGGPAGTAGAAGATEPSLKDLAAAFEGLRLDLKCHHPQENPCEPQNSAVPNRGYLCCYVDETIERDNLPPVDEELPFLGDPSKVYDLTLRIRGVMENHDYGDQGVKQGDWVLIGGELPAPGAIHVFGFTVRDPQQTYFFNSWNDKTNPARIIAMDYEVTLPVRGGSKVRVFEYDDIGKIWANAESLKVEGVPPYPDAFDGQFMQVDVVSVVQRP